MPVRQKPFHLAHLAPALPGSVQIPPEVVAKFRARMVPVGSRGCMVLRRRGAWALRSRRLDLYPEEAWRDAQGIRHTIRANRLALMLEIGNIPEGMMALHRCDTPACVASAHLGCGHDVANKEDRARSERLRKLGLPFTLHPMRRPAMACVEVRAG